MQDWLSADFRSGVAGHLTRLGALLWSVNWRDVNNYANYPQTGLLVYDIELDSITSVTRDDRCGDMYEFVLTADGTAYFASGRHNAALWILDRESGVRPCILRVLPGDSRFDPDFFVALDDVTRGVPSGGAIAAGDSEALIAAFDAGRFEVGPDTDLFDLRNSDAWRWWRLRLGEADALAEQASDLPFNAGGRYVIDGVPYTTVPTADYASTTLYAPSGDREFEPGITMRGSPYSILRVR